MPTKRGAVPRRATTLVRRPGDAVIIEYSSSRDLDRAASVAISLPKTLVGHYCVDLIDAMSIDQDQNDSKNLIVPRGQKLTGSAESFPRLAFKVAHYCTGEKGDREKGEIAL